MTSEQMREAAAKIVDATPDYFNLAKRIRAIPLTAPEPTMLDRLARLAWIGATRRDHARNVLEAMREPTEAMVEAGAQCTYSRGEAIDTYRAMIDAALAEK